MTATCKHRHKPFEPRKCIVREGLVYRVCNKCGRVRKTEDASARWQDLGSLDQKKSP